MFIDNQSKNKLFSDKSLWFLLLSNIIVIFFAIKGEWSLSTTMWIYWSQSITIGFFNFIRILQLKDFSTEGLTRNGQSLQPTQKTKNEVAFFFLFHFGLFHLAYFAVLSIDPLFNRTYIGESGFTESKFIVIAALIFFINHLFSYFYNKPKDTKKQKIGSLMFYPYARVIPMHLTLVIGSSLSSVLPFFLILKTFADCIMHIVEHRVLRKGEE